MALVNDARQKKYNWKCVNAKLRPEDLPVLNQRLKIYGYQTLGQLVKDFLICKFLPITDDRQIEMMGNDQSTGQRTMLLGSFGPSFYKNIDLEDMFKYFLKVRKLDDKHARDLVSYFRRFRDVFFGPDPEQIHGLKPHKRAWILQGMRNFALYYYYKTNNIECKELVSRIIERFQLNRGLDMHHRIYIVDDNFVATKISALMAIEGEIGLTVKVGLFTGLREDEIIYVHQKEICSNLAGCSCARLHVVNKPEGLSVVVINWHRGHKKCYFTIIPTNIWNQFRELPSLDYSDIKIAHGLTKKIGNVMFVELRKLHYNVMCRTMEMNEADILAGRTKSISARHYSMYELDRLVDCYKEAWEKMRVNVQ
jgi:intergrase/recombinase